MSSLEDARFPHIAELRKRRRWFYVLMGPGTLGVAIALAAYCGPLRAHWPIAPDARIQLATRRAQYEQLRRLRPIPIAVVLLGTLLWPITGRDIFGLIGIGAGAVAGMVIQFLDLRVRASIRCPTCRFPIGQALYARRCGGCGAELPEQAA